jgi:hypothetical protein
MSTDLNLWRESVRDGTIFPNHGNIYSIASVCVVLGGVEACRSGGAQGEQRRTRTTGPGQTMT